MTEHTPPHFDYDYNTNGVFVFEQFGKRTSNFYQFFTHPREDYIKVWRNDELLEIIAFSPNADFEKIYQEIDLTDERYYHLQKPEYIISEWNNLD